MTPGQLCASAQQSHVAGDLATAEALYRAALRLDPRHAESLHGLGRLAYGSGQSARAIELPSVPMTMRHGPPGNLHLRA